MIVAQIGSDRQADFKWSDLKCIVEGSSQDERKIRQK
jgi:hypothetical protein